ncbi:MAG TPA: phosphatase PAP2 family protein [Candidatus Megaira endosymbiont of Nemacystus decipiens]|nr:phosphatase PAP2 family protein [Candidatus Megaera endosymbiont of Nemacystus decipiens]
MTNYLDFIARILLEFSHETIIIPLLIVGYIWINREIFFHGICIVLLSMIFNTSLKATFQIPLNPSIGKVGFAFPSGHMQTSVSLYGFLYTFTRSILLKTFLIVLLALIGVSLIYLGYHSIVDVFGAVFFASALIYSYKYLSKNVKALNFFLMIGVFASTLLVYIKSLHAIPPHLWMSFYALLGLLASQYYFDHKKTLGSQTKKSKLIATIYCFSFLFLVNAAFAVKSEITLFIAPLRWFCIGILIPFSVFLSNRSSQ